MTFLLGPRTILVLGLYIHPSSSFRCRLKAWDVVVVDWDLIYDPLTATANETRGEV